MSGNIEDLEIAAKVARQLGFYSFRSDEDGKIILYRFDELGKVGSIYTGFMPGEGHLYIATVKWNGALPTYGESTVFYSGDFPAGCIDEDNVDDLHFTHDDLINFVKQAIKDYYSNLFD